MTEAELLEVAFDAWGNTVALLTLFASLMSGYLIVAYTVGDEMTKSQSLIVTGLYLLLAGFVLYAMHEMALRAAEMETLAFELTTQRSLSARLDIARALVTIGTLCIGASVKFMWDARSRSHSESPAAD